MEELNPQEQATQDVEVVKEELVATNPKLEFCLLYTSDAADEE